jgi:allophanate hydrolase
MLVVDIASLDNGYRNGSLVPADIVRQIYSRIRRRGERPVWIHLIPEEETLALAESGDSDGRTTLTVIRG